MDAMSLLVLIVMFVGSGAVTWLAGVVLTKTTDTLDHRFKIGDAIGGLVLLGIAGSLPEIAVVYSAAVHDHIPVILGTLIGGLSIQTLIVVLFDAASGRERPLSYVAGSAMLSFETLFAVAVTIIALLAVLVPARLSVFHINPLSAGLLIAWVAGLFLINKARQVPRFNETAEDAAPGRKHHERRHQKPRTFFAGKSTLHVILVFLGASAITLIAGWLLEESGNAIAGKLGIGTGIFAATFIALATSIPEISTGLESIFIGDNHLAVSDIMGGNAFMLVLFLFADLVARKPVLNTAERSDIVFGVLALAMMSVYAVSFLKRPRKCYFRLGIDSILALLLYIGGAILITRIR